MKKQKSSYHFTPAGFISNFTPLIVINYGEDKVLFEGFEYKMWNILQITSFNTQESELLKELIIEVSQSNECEAYIFMYGNTRYIDKAIINGVIPQKHIYSVDRVELQNKDNLKKVLDEFEKMAPEL